MKKLGWWLAGGWLAVVGQAYFLSSLNVAFQPNLVVVLLVAVGARASTKHAAAYGLWLGAWLDIFSAGSFGVNLIAAFTVGVCVAGFGRWFDLGRLRPLSLAVGAGVLIYGVVIWLGGWLLGSFSNPASYLPSLVVQFILSLPLAWGLIKLLKLDSQTVRF